MPALGFRGDPLATVGTGLLKSDVAIVFLKSLNYNISVIYLNLMERCAVREN
ncbi:hypothetical protein DOT_5117 [Desulfosporosinus sp. OT]|nr:hypothetical protein DOT_5117 [Desulfosporosinus sp. OT]